MNRLAGTIRGIESAADVSRVDIDIDGDLFSAVLLDTPETDDYLREGAAITMVFKESEVALAKNFTGLLSFRNQFPSRVESIERGRILTRVGLTYHSVRLTSLITTRSADILDLRAGDVVTALVKANEVTLMR